MEDRGQIAGLRHGQEFHGGGAEVAAAFERTAIEQHLAEPRVVRRSGIERNEMILVADTSVLINLCRLGQGGLFQQL